MHLRVPLVSTTIDRCKVPEVGHGVRRPLKNACLNCKQGRANCQSPQRIRAVHIHKEWCITGSPRPQPKALQALHGSHHHIDTGQRTDAPRWDGLPGAWRLEHSESICSPSGKRLPRLGRAASGKAAPIPGPAELQATTFTVRAAESQGVSRRGCTQQSSDLSCCARCPHIVHSIAHHAFLCSASAARICGRHLTGVGGIAAGPGRPLSSSPWPVYSASVWHYTPPPPLSTPTAPDLYNHRRLARTDVEPTVVTHFRPCASHC